MREKKVNAGTRPGAAPKPKATRRRRALAAAMTLLVLLLLVPSGQGPSSAPAQGISKIKHVVIIMQENRSFDSYFGTFPGADGIAMQNGVPTACLPDPGRNGCARPFHDSADSNAGGPHSHADEVADAGNGAMDGFVVQAEKGLAGCKPVDANCQYGSKETDVMGYHDGRDLPNYWAYARNFTLQDHMFAAAASWSLPAHLYLVSEWSAKCTKAGDPSSCVNALQNPDAGPDPETIRGTLIGKCQAGLDLQPCQEALQAAGISPDLAREIDQLISASCKPADSYPTCQAAVDAAPVPASLKQKLSEAAKKLELPDYAWTDLTYLLHQQHVPWAYYVFDGTEPDCRDDAATCAPVKQNAKTPACGIPSCTSTPSRRTANWATSSPRRTSTTLPAKAPSLPLAGWRQQTRSASMPPPRSALDRPTLPGWSTPS